MSSGSNAFSHTTQVSDASRFQVLRGLRAR